ncbi:uncharacterized protein EI97DRAFT_79406 [Westerdykella ornata]|uniref:R3H domain protein n=1 Tax=Westerdykella ornata TaxID=318751 RepID=A0A6A6JFS3_WESOR|nr:uncharacterized protein EI97DRAFT_79406 [Westerdykella ornata]KAF2275177.1 hypothetical protein EI97DRAFT_79406 [Westerdykella ornata]
MYQQPSSAYDAASSRSPGSHRHQPQSLHRQPSRQLDAYAQPPLPGLYPGDDPSRAYDQRAYDRTASTIHSPYEYNLGNGNLANAWNTTGFSQNATLSTLGAAGRLRQPQRNPRGNLPANWLVDQPPPLPTFALPGLGSGHQNNVMGGHQLRQENLQQDTEDEIIPTAIVIKNIPFAVKKEQLQNLMADMGIPIPYAFNYHFDSGVFRGLAFANYHSAEETAEVIRRMNHLELSGRKLRVEYKKMLPIAERERIEREKRERRGQLEEQHRPMATSNLQVQSSYGSLATHAPAPSPSPVSGMRGEPKPDMNDPQVLQFYTQLLLFKENGDRESMTFPPTLSPSQRRIVHTLAHFLGLMHVSKGTNDQRQIHIFKVHNSSNLSPPMQQLAQNHAIEQPRRGLNRAATTDFSDVRASEGFYNAFGRQPSSGLLGFAESSGGLNASHNLRAAKSYADLRSYTPSPAPSTASHPIGRVSGTTETFAFNTTTSTNPAGTPINTTMTQRDDVLEREMSRMQIGSSFGQGGSPRSLRQMTSWENPGPIGGHRTFSTPFEDQSRERGLPSRQPRGPVPERGSGFSRPRQNGHQGRGSDELSSQSTLDILGSQ